MPISKKSAKKPHAAGLCWRVALAATLVLACPWQIPAAEETLVNIAPGPVTGLQPGMLILLPDGRRAAIQESLPDGNYSTNLGVVITPSGVIVDGPLKGEQAILPKNVVLPEAKTPEPAVQPEEPQAKSGPSQAAPDPQSAPDQNHELTIAELLPMTKVPEASPEAKKPEPAKPEVKEQPKAAQKQPEKKAPEQKPAAKPKPGQELRIPPEAAKTGNLAFLEGCWQGTRPEYYSKRTIRECFCFGANGKNGKRRVIDPQGHRMCIGSSQARLASDGTLSVTSSGAACNDGQRWGQAEMVCKNSGPSTPCSWVFRDAQNGSQSYRIPFVRVESCGR